MDITKSVHKIILRDRPLIFLDLETTGFSVSEHEIIEIGALRSKPYPPFELLEEFSIKVQPKNIQKASKKALKIVGYSPLIWEGAVEIDEALNKLDIFAQEGVLVGYNVSFDWAFLDRAYHNLGRQDPFYYHRIDVMSIAYAKLFDQNSLDRFSLGQVADFLKIPQEGKKHHALDDVKVTYEVFKKLMEV